jgi:predicted enzyme related to lactoylglutathione lyase
MANSHGRFVWYGLMTTDVAAAKAFYTKVVGWGAQDASTPDMPYILFTVGMDSVCGLMELPEDARRMGVTPRWIGYVGVDDVDSTADRIGRLGGTVHVPPTDVAGISRFSVFADPQLATLALFKWLHPGQPQPPDVGGPGHVGWHELLATDWETAFAFYAELFGWRRADTDIGPIGEYQLFSAAGQTVGGMFTKPPFAKEPFWLYYFNIGDIDAAIERVKARGGQILDGPVEVSGGSWVARCTDPQGATFALEGKRNPNTVGYFKRDPSDARGRRWSW